MSTKKKTWTGQEKLAIVLQGLRGNCRISELCNEHVSSYFPIIQSSPHYLQVKPFTALFSKNRHARLDFSRNGCIVYFTVFHVVA